MFNFENHFMQRIHSILLDRLHPAAVDCYQTPWAIPPLLLTLLQLGYRGARPHEKGV